ncbi:uncharacterized protein LOC107626922 [Arachis ipaensis]|uniref:uncharacterized protein LOC107626922 n=1 Tax=Arachis ipaensis TaxID=130454 RepID=UPI0007AF2781|nr:uncharacterized protein LOC107626922 [Arachis ipaensis]XP_025635745.1 uncharacterized protein LOC112729814 [Arachis hypogaea]
MCQVEECCWVVYASRDHEDTCWQIKTFYDDHTCPRENSNRAANRAWLASKLVKKVRKYPNFKQCEAATYFRSKCDLILHRNSLARALADARNIVYRDEKTNPGSTVKIGVTPLPDGQVMFDKIYICLSGCKNGFKAGCRPLIGLDGAFLKTQIGGQILSAVAQDANHHIYVVAWAIVNIENKENWKWFLELLHEDLGDYKANGWCFISDMQKGLISAVEEVMPQVHHRFCVWHLWRNFNKQWKDLELRRLLWDAARSTTFQDFIGNMDKIKRVSEEAWTYLNKWPRHSWTKSQFSHRPKLDNICNNACEVFNARIKEARSKPIITLLEEVRMFVMRSIAKNKIKLNNHIGKLPPVIQSRLEKVRKESKNWVPIWTGDEAYEKFEVHGQPTNMVVDLGKRLCTCQLWMLTGIPCVHACAALARVNKRPEDFCHPLKRADELAAALAAAAAAVAASKDKVAATGSTPAPEASNSTNPATSAADIPPPVSGPQAEEVELSQPSYGRTQDEAPPPPATRPPMLPTKWKTTPQPVTTSVDPMQGASAATSSRLARFMKMVPTPQFKAPRKKNP